MDMTKFIIPKSDQINADDLMGGPRTITVTGVRGTDAADQPVAIHYDGDAGKPYKPCKSMRRVMVQCWGKDAANYAGRSMTLYCDPDVQFGGMKVGGIRISHMSHIDGKKQMALTATRGKKAPFTVLPLTDVPKPQQAEPAGLTIDQVRERLKQAATYGNEALETEWRRKTTAPYRDELRADLDVLKSAAPADETPAQDGGGYDGV